MQKYLQCIQSNDLIGFNIVERGLSMEICTQSTSIHTLKKTLNIGDRELITILSSMILRASDHFNITNNVSENQAIDTASLLLEKYGYETLEDFSLIFKKAKKAEFGKVYNRIDTQIIFEWCEKHFEDKAILREQIHRNIKHEGIKNDQDSVKMIESNFELGKPIIDALKEAVFYDPEEEKKEIDFDAWRKEYLKSKILKSGKDGKSNN